MIRNQKNFLVYGILHVYTQWLIRRAFHEFSFNAIEIDPDRSVLLVANHFSFWDALIMYKLNRAALKKKFHVMVREDTTKSMHHLKYGGAFSVNKKSRDMLENSSSVEEMVWQVSQVSWLLYRP